MLQGLRVISHKVFIGGCTLHPSSQFQQPIPHPPSNSWPAVRTTSRLTKQLLHLRPSPEQQDYHHPPFRRWLTHFKLHSRRLDQLVVPPSRLQPRRVLQQLLRRRHPSLETKRQPLHRQRPRLRRNLQFTRKHAQMGIECQCSYAGGIRWWCLGLGDANCRLWTV